MANMCAEQEHKEVKAINYRPEIDGLRAFAVIPVILFHMGIKRISGGYIGVDVFFVISGFLITSIVKKELEAGSFSFREFWARRIRRILPAMIIVTAVTLSFVYLFSFRGDHPLIGKQAISALLSFANIYHWQTTGYYWGRKAEDSPFLHTWSLSVEEQFYLVFPVVFFIILRFRPQWLQGFMLFVIILSLPFFLYGSRVDPTATFYLLPTRAWELATGCYLAVIPQGQRIAGSNTNSFESLGLCGLCMVIASYVLVPTLNGGLAIAVLGTAFIIAFAQSGMCNTILAQRHIVHVGKMSYSLYLWHWPVLLFAERLGFESHKVVLFIPIYLLSLASYYLVEKPTRHRTAMIPSIAVCFVLTLGFSAALVFSSPFYDTSAFEKSQWSGAFYDLTPPHEHEPDAEFELIRATMEVPKRESAPDAYRNGGIIVGSGDLNPKIVVLGDSHGTMWSDSIRSVTEKLGLKTSFISMSGVTPFVKLPLSHEQKVGTLSSEEKYADDMSRLGLINSWKPDLVILSVRWSVQAEVDTTDLLRILEEHSARILLMEQPPELAVIGNRNVLQYAVFLGIKPEVGVKKYLPIGNSVEYEKGRELIRTLAKRHKNIGCIPTYDLFAEKSQALILDGKNIVYMDDDHLTTYGARLAFPRIEQVISDTVKSIRKK